MKVENLSIITSAKSISAEPNVYEKFNALNVHFIALNSYIAFDNLERYAENILENLNDLNNYFSDLPIYDSNSTLSPKEKVIAAKTKDMLAEFILDLEKFCQDSTYPLKPALKRAILQLSLIKAFTFYPTATQSDLIYLMQFSSLFTQQFAYDLVFTAPSKEEALKDPQSFAKQVEAFGVLESSFNALMPHIPNDSPYKAKLCVCYQNLFSATFKAKMLLNHIHFGQTDAIENLVCSALDAYTHFLDQIELPF